MEIKKRRIKEIEEMKQEIIKAAVRLFLAEGYPNVSMRKIAREIDYSATTIYNYFANKEEILIHLLKYAYAKFLNSLVDASKADETVGALERLKAALHAYITFGLQNPDYYQLIFIENLHHLQVAGSKDNDRFKGFLLLTDAVTEAMEEGVLKKDNPALVSQSLWASLHGITSLLIKFPGFDWCKEEELVSFHVEAMISGMK
ncbi:TetR/AcrR family transcriptional regulator [Bacillus songklensis]|uniref:TetR/AcrR family transcriptional regulator n=1 Tax=Bacillus songklensis TaxID=1069116 RepID=A0ABV8B927_9BACI